MTTAEAGPSTAPVATRTSSRIRQKSSRALDSEDTEKLIAAVKSRASAASTPVPEPDAAGATDATEPSRKGKERPKRGAASAPAKYRKSKYCVCKEARPGPMIECGECGNWFHFDCLNLEPEEAEQIHNYVCADCEPKTGKKTTKLDDIEALASPKPTADVEVKVTGKRKASGKKKATSPPPEDPPSPKSQSESDEESEAAPSEAESEADSDDEKRQRPAKRARPPPRTAPAARRPSKSEPRPKRPSPVRKSSNVSAAALPPARQYVLDKMAATIRGIYGEDKMSPAFAEEYGRKVEATIFTNFKEVIKGKEAAGGRYKAQFNLLHSSLSKDVRPDLKQDIVDGTLPPSKLALLNSEQLATAEQLEVINKAKQEALRQTVKIKDDMTGEVRIGRDGFEKAEDRREVEMGEIARLEEAQRRRESGVVEPEPTPASPVRRESVEVAASPQTAISGSPVAATVASPKSPILRRKSSATLPPRAPAASLQSAWGSNVVEEINEAIDFDEENQKIDLSDIVPDDITYDDDLDDIAEEKPVEEKSALQVFLDKPAGWKGGLSNPAKESPQVPPIQLRIAAGRVSSPPPEEYWARLLPQPVIAITGRVPTAHSLQYLSDRRMDRTKELVTVVFTLDDKATPDERAAFDEVVEFHVQRDRHGIYHPYGDRPPRGTARELYLIPLRPSDPTPELMHLFDNYAVPQEGRTESVFLGVFVVSRDTPPGTVQSPAEPQRRAPPAPLQHQPYQPPQPPAIRSPVAPPEAAPKLPNLQGLLASLNPTAIANVINTQPNRPPPPPPPTLPGVHRPPPMGYYPPPPAPYPGQDAYPPRADEYNPGGYDPRPQHDPYGYRSPPGPPGGGRAPPPHMDQYGYRSPPPGPGPRGGPPPPRGPGGPGGGWGGGNDRYPPPTGPRGNRWGGGGGRR
ncbi:hypothetical protein Q8F55_007202 [Vanrija albida]|uniref:Transcription factor BYE1 n=1 Tax=Vanrija albida TaxID=181172 RepID=A0ABR3PZ80_9TREE